MPCLIVGIGGVTCGGKTTIAEELKKHAKPEADVISLDDYFWEEGSPKHVYLPEFEYENWDIPSSLDFEKLTRDVLMWKEKWKGCSEQHILIVEGFLIYACSALLGCFDLKFFLTLTEQQCWERRRVRDYLPPEPNGYFHAIAWPCYIEHRNCVSSLDNIVYIDGSNSKADICLSVEKHLNEVMKNSATID